MSISKLDPVQMQRTSFNEEKSAYRVDMVDNEFQIELDHNDGDSVYSHKKMQVIQYKAGQIIDTKIVETICCTEDVSITAVILTKEFPLGDLLKMTTLSICVPSIKINKDCTIILRG